MATDEVTNSQEDLLAKATVEWEQAQFLFIERAWRGKPVASHYVEVLKTRSDLEPELVKLLSHPSQLVAAYSLLTLDLMDSSAVGVLPEVLLKRSEKLTKLMGSFADKMEFGAFARQIQKQWLARHPSGQGKGRPDGSH